MQLATQQIRAKQVIENYRTGHGIQSQGVLKKLTFAERLSEKWHCTHLFVQDGQGTKHKQRVGLLRQECLGCFGNRILEETLAQLSIKSQRSSTQGIKPVTATLLGRRECYCLIIGTPLQEESYTQFAMPRS